MPVVYLLTKDFKVTSIIKIGIKTVCILRFKHVTNRKVITVIIKEEIKMRKQGGLNF